MSRSTRWSCVRIRRPATFLSLLLGVLLWAGGGTEARAQGSVSLTCVSGDCQNGRGVARGSDDRLITGSFRDGWLYGQARIEFTDGTVYEGEMRKGQVTGYGILRNPDGSVYRGEFVQGRRNGQGTLRYRSGSTYTGDFVQDRRDGEGVHVRLDGTVYDGGWRDDEKYGHARYTDEYGTVIEGFNVDGAFEGAVTITDTASGATWTGTYRDGDPDGEGVYRDVNGNVLGHDRWAPTNLESLLYRASPRGQTETMLWEIGEAIDEVDVDGALAALATFATYLEEAPKDPTWGDRSPHWRSEWLPVMRGEILPRERAKVGYFLAQNGKMEHGLEILGAAYPQLSDEDRTAAAWSYATLLYRRAFQVVEATNRRIEAAGGDTPETDVKFREVRALLERSSEVGRAADHPDRDKLLAEVEQRLQRLDEYLEGRQEGF